MKFPPKVSFLRSMRGERVNYSALVGEAIDNALDANARRITLKITDKLVKFEDDGIGVTRDRIESLFSLGDHGAMTSTQLGRFGVGIKAQAINSADVFAIKSTSKDGCFWVQVNWREVLASGKWEADDPTWMPHVVGKPTGTLIELTGLRTPQKYTLDRLSEEIALRFHPAVAEDGKIIILNHGPIAPLPEPGMTDVIERHISLSNGRSAKLRAGILVRPGKLHRVHVAFRHRVIMPASSIGCSDYGGISKMFARLRLMGPWHLGRYKDELTDEDERDELEIAVGEILEPILEKCNAASMDARLAALGELINDKLPSELAAARPHHRTRKPKPRPGEKRKRPSGVVDIDKSDEGGPAKAKRPQQARLMITFEGKAEQDGIGSFHPGRPNRVDFSADHPRIAEFVQHRDQDLASDALVTLAFALYEQGRQEREPELPFEPFGVRIANLLNLQPTTGKASAQS